MPKVVLKENEVLDDALKRFKRQVSRNGTLAEARKREFYVKPGVRRKLKSEAARKARRGKSEGIERSAAMWIFFSYLTAAVHILQ